MCVCVCVCLSAGALVYGRRIKAILTHPFTAEGHNSVGQHIISRHISTRMSFISLALFQASTAMYRMSVILLDTRKRVVVIQYRRFGTNYQYHLQGSVILVTDWNLQM